MSEPNRTPERTPPATPETTNRFFISECGGYVCRVAPGDSWGSFEAWTVDGSIHWENDQRIKTWEDAREPRHPLPFGVGGYSATKTGQKKGSFTLNLLRCDTTMIIEPYKGNTIIESLDVVFRRKVPAGHYAAWKRRLGIERKTA